MKKILIIGMTLFTLSLGSVYAEETDTQTCSEQFWDAHQALLNAGWGWDDAYDYLLPGYQICEYGQVLD
ncbi:MAG: hypothetical protein CMC13_16045 [Flavobacteriaceae bacterium]|nr:hypothetical protein [Flavobacteriaceae bacterium]|tara:strand:- start:1067 stop:1273 length:207 start_codon:yes stop_codon:yes gene_type:complete